jgi:putative tricarboxylic transport membrane protein
MLPGAGAEVASMASYAAEKRRARDPERFGKGAVEGLAGPEAANNAGSIGAFVPLLTLGIPGSVTTALLFGALLLQGITPGPTLINDEPGVFYGVIASMYIGNIMLVLLNIPLIKLFVQILRVRLSILAPLIVTVVMVGAYSLNNAAFDMWVLIAFGIVGYLARKTGFSMAPLALTFVLGPVMENAFRQSLLISNGSLAIFVTRPITATILCIAVVMVLLPILRFVWNSRARRTE